MRIEKRVRRILKQEDDLFVGSQGVEGAGVTGIAPPGVAGAEMSKEPRTWILYIALGIELPPTIDDAEEAYAYVDDTLGLSEDLSQLPGYFNHGQHKPGDEPFQ